jgi:hypothetical protein
MCRVISVAGFAGLTLYVLCTPSADALGYILPPAFAGFQSVSA